jgi:hypothetical protein
MEINKKYKTRLKEEEEFVKYWRANIEKKLFRIAKEKGFYITLKKVLNPANKTNHDYEIKNLYREILGDIRCNKDKVLKMDELECSKKNYPIRCALTSNLYLSHIICLVVLQKCKLSHTLFKECFNTLTTNMFKGKWFKTRYIENKSWLKLLLS